MEDQYEEELNIDELLIPNFRAQTNTIEKYTCSSTSLPQYDASTPLVKFMEAKWGSFSFKEYD